MVKDVAIDRERITARMEGCFVPLPTLFHEDLSLNLDDMRRHAQFLLNGGLRAGNAVLLTTGASGDFPCLSPAERLQVAEAVLAETAGEIGVIVGAQSTNQAETIENYFKDGSQWNVHIAYGRQLVQDGTGKAPELAKEFIGPSPFLLTYGDILVKPETYQQMIHRYNEDYFSGVVTVTPGEDVTKGGLNFLRINSTN